MFVRLSARLLQGAGRDAPWLGYRRWWSSVPRDLAMQNRLPSGALVLGMADTVVFNDPITGQGSNNAAKSARVYLKSILDNRDNAFDRVWMQQTFDTYWDRRPRRQDPRRCADVSQDRPSLRQRLRRPANLLPMAHRSGRGGSVHH
jgi:flavin-dependent dehydrogenase